MFVLQRTEWPTVNIIINVTAKGDLRRLATFKRNKVFEVRGTEPVGCGVGLQYSIFFRLLFQMLSFLVINPRLHDIPVEVLRNEFIYHIQ